MPTRRLLSARSCTRSAEEVDEQGGRVLRLFLLHPVSGAGNQVRAAEVAAAPALHALELAGLLVHAPVARAGYVHRRNIDRLARGRGRELGGVPRVRGAAVPLQPAL